MIDAKKPLISGKSFPNNVEAEIAVLGGLLQDNSVLPQVTQSLFPDDFYLEAHQKIYQAMIELSDSAQPIDLLTIGNKLEEKGDLTTIGGQTYLAHLIDEIPTTAHIEYYVQIVKEKALIRRVVQASRDIAIKGMGEYGEAEQYLDEVEASIFRVTQQRIFKPYVHIKELVHETFEEIEQAGKRGEKITGVPSGFLDLDDKTAGFQKGDLIVVAGRPSMGKTAFALNIATNSSLKHERTVLIFSLEMSRHQLVRRMLCSEGRIDSSRLRTGRLSKEEWAQLIETASVLSESPLYVDDTPALPVMQLRTKARRLKSEFNLDMIIIDYLQLMKGSPKPESREKEISEISSSLKALAKELDIPIIALSQLNRELERRGDKRPMLADLRESGAIEQDADLILFIYRDEVYNENTSDPNIAEIIIGKQRNGPTGTVMLHFSKENTRFDNLAV